MSEEIQRIRRMVAQGKVTPEEGEQLIASVAEVPPAAHPPPMPTAVSTTSPPVRAWWVLWPLISHGLILAGICVVLTVSVPKFQEIFKSLGVDLPLMMRVVFTASSLAKHWGFLILPASAGALALDALFYAFLRRRGWHVVAALWWWCITILGILVVAFLCLGTYLPLVTLMRAMGASAGRP